MKEGDKVELKVPVGTVLPIAGKVTQEHWVRATVRGVNKDQTIVAHVEQPDHEWNDLFMTCDVDHYRLPA